MSQYIRNIQKFGYSDRNYLVHIDQQVQIDSHFHCAGGYVLLYIHTLQESYKEDTQTLLRLQVQFREVFAGKYSGVGVVQYLSDQK